MNKFLSRLVVGSVVIALYAALVYLSPKSTSATVVFVAFNCINLLGCGLLLGERQTRRRAGWPALIAFPVEIALAVWAVSLGGWLAFGGLCLVLGSFCELIIFGDVQSTT